MLEPWRDDLKKLLTVEGDYRSACVSPEQLGGVIVDPAAPAERRVAAAVAPAARERREAKQRARITVQACVSSGGDRLPRAALTPAPVRSV